jgi:hypothetical protein
MNCGQHLLGCPINKSDLLLWRDSRRADREQRDVSRQEYDNNDRQIRTKRYNLKHGQ